LFKVNAIQQSPFRVQENATCPIALTSGYGLQMNGNFYVTFQFSQYGLHDE